MFGLGAAVAGAVCVEVVGPDTSFGGGSKADFVYGNIVVILQVYMNEPTDVYGGDSDGLTDGLFPVTKIPAD